MTRTGATSEPRGVLSIKPFRRLWIALTLSSFGDWLSILALTALAGTLTAGDSYQVRSYAVGGVLIVKMLPAVILGPLGGAMADRLDRRLTMVIADLCRFGLFLSIPLVGTLTWLFVATFLVECVTLFWMPAKEATVPNLVPKEKLEQANQLSLFTTYGSAPVAAGLFAILTLIAGAAFPKARQADLALYFNAVTFLISAITIFTLKTVRGPAQQVSVPSVLGQILAGWRFAGSSPLVRGLTIGMTGAFAAGGVVIGVAPVYVRSMHGGDPAYGMVFGAVFVGLALGMFLGPRMLRGFSRRRMFGLSLVFAGLALVLIALVQNIVIVVFLSSFLGAGAGIAWVTGYTLIGLEVADELRGRTFAFLQSLVRVVLLLTLALVPLLVGKIGAHSLKLLGKTSYRFDGTNAVLLIAAVLALVVGVVAYRQMDDRRGIPLGRDLLGTLRGVPYVPVEPITRNRGVLIAFEGGEGAGKTTQSRLAAIWLRDHGYDVVTTQEPGATKVGMRLRAILLDKESTGLSSRAETLLYAADRADHVAAVIAPAIRRGAIVVTDRYIDSTLAYQGYGRDLPVAEIAEVNKWATGGLLPDLTIVLDVPPETGLKRFAPAAADRMESEPKEFHDAVRRGFRELAAAEPHRYLVVDASQDQQAVTRLIQDRIREILPDPIPLGTEDATSTFPAIRD
jgi:dTMP kinase